MTITIEHLPEAVSKVLEERARREGKSVADVAVEILSDSAKAVDARPPIDLSIIAGTMSEEDARIIEETVRRMDAADLAARS